MIIKLFEKADPKETETWKEMEALKKRVDELEAKVSKLVLKAGFDKK